MKINQGLSLAYLQKRYGFTEEQARVALKDPEFVLHVEASISSSSTVSLIDDLTTATKNLTAMQVSSFVRTLQGASAGTFLGVVVSVPILVAFPIAAIPVIAAILGAIGGGLVGYATPPKAMDIT